MDGVKDFLWRANPFKTLAYRILCSYNAIKAIWTQQKLAFQVVPDGGQARFHAGIIIHAEGRKYVTSPIIDVAMTKEQVYILAGSCERTAHFLIGGRE